MISEHSSEIVSELRQGTAPSGEPVELLVFGNDLTLAVSARTLAVYRHPDQFGDPLGNGLVNSVQLPDDLSLRAEDGRLIAGIQSGCVNLLDGRVLLILPNEARLYPDPPSALHNRGVLASIALAR